MPATLRLATAVSADRATAEGDEASASEILKVSADEGNVFVGGPLMMVFVGVLLLPFIEFSANGLVELVLIFLLPV